MVLDRLEDAMNVVLIPEVGILPFKISPDLGDRFTQRRQNNPRQRSLNASVQCLRPFVRTGWHLDQVPTAQ